MEHTKEPWSYEGFVYCDNGGKTRQIVGANGDEVVGEFGLDEDDARRIVACVNACAGIDTAGLEAKGVMLVATNTYQAVIEQRDQLLAALELARDHIDMAELEISHCKDAAAIRAAITRVKGETCGTCEGRGVIGGFVSADSGYQDDPCPECSVKEAQS